MVQLIRDRSKVRSKQDRTDRVIQLELIDVVHDPTPNSTGNTSSHLTSCSTPIGLVCVGGLRGNPAETIQSATTRSGPDSSSDWLLYVHRINEHYHRRERCTVKPGGEAATLRWMSGLLSRIGHFLRHLFAPHHTTVTRTRPAS